MKKIIVCILLLCSIVFLTSLVFTYFKSEQPSTGRYYVEDGPEMQKILKQIDAENLKNIQKGIKK